MADHALTCGEVGADDATGERPIGSVHADGVVGAREQVGELELLTVSINQDGLSSN